MVETYAELGYELVELPRAPIAARLAFILAAGAAAR
jgi:predicted ATPase